MIRYSLFGVLFVVGICVISVIFYHCLPRESGRFRRAVRLVGESGGLDSIVQESNQLLDYANQWGNTNSTYIFPYEVLADRAPSILKLTGKRVVAIKAGNTNYHNHLLIHHSITPFSAEFIHIFANKPTSETLSLWTIRNDMLLGSNVYYRYHRRL